MDQPKQPRHDWTLAEAEALFALPFPQLMHAAQQVHQRFHDVTRVQMSTLLSIKTGACPEDCAYCPQSVRFETGLESEALLPLASVAAPRAFAWARRCARPSSAISRRFPPWCAR
jgi:biotin synthase